MNRANEARGLLLGAVGITCFSFTLPMTRLAVTELDPIVVGLGRALVAACFGAMILLWKREPLPARRHWPSLAIVALGAMIAFPLLTSIALRHAPSSHAAVVTGLLPLSTALFAVLRAHERPSKAFWVAALAGSSVVVVFALAESGWRISGADTLLLVAVVACGLSYAEGGRLAREIGGWRVICWSLLFAAPLVIVPVGANVFQHGLHASARGWFGFGYVSLISVFLGFIVWYQGLALGGVARIGQVQLVQPFLTFMWAGLLLNESITARTLLTALIVIAVVALGRRAAVIRPVPATA
ncbi:DMT family transporter [Horticoccus sp. 23ND18S-11]|uniref:DMT family transporter n=1 Tax=Horticoccus sp. 23ND18S-11 TaxID=3391832 RepID=UPI0039C9EC91